MIAKDWISSSNAVRVCCVCMSGDLQVDPVQRFHSSGDASRCQGGASDWRRRSNGVSDNGGHPVRKGAGCGSILLSTTLARRRSLLLRDFIALSQAADLRLRGVAARAHLRDLARRSHLLGKGNMDLFDPPCGEIRPFRRAVWLAGDNSSSIITSYMQWPMLAMHSRGTSLHHPGPVQLA